ncbi:MAG: S8 family serine peptidase [Acidimicrobiales bacterium]|nr:S8 family serine peptidase [Acidimicrobiales bacterium]
MRSTKTFVIIFLTLALSAASCSESTDLNTVRQATLGELGGVIEGISIQRPWQFEPDYIISFPKDLTWTTPQKNIDDLILILDELEVAPVVLHLPGAWQADGTFSSSSEKALDKELTQQRQELEGAIEMVQQELESSRNYSRRDLDFSTYFETFERLFNEREQEASKNSRDTDSQSAPINDAKPITAQQYWSPLGNTPFVRALVDQASIESLIEKDLIIGVSLDIPVYSQLEDSLAHDLVGSEELTEFLGVDGFGTTVAIIDSGIYAGHPAFGGRVVLEACFDGYYSLCPTSGGSTAASSIGPGTSAPAGGGIGVCGTLSDHGTHVAGIIAGASTPVALAPAGNGAVLPLDAWPAGVAPKANLANIRISRCYNAANDVGLGSDVTLGLNQVAAWVNGGQNIVATNISQGFFLGGFTNACDTSTTTTTALKTAVDNLISLNVATIFASGNDSSRSQVAFPACISTVIAVGNTTKQDAVAGSSNFNTTLVDIQAPGTNIVAAAENGGAMVYESKTGTSMAAPHVAGAWALIRELYPTMNVATVLNLLQTTGVAVADNRGGGSGLSIPRLDLEAALEGLTSGLPAGQDDDRFEYFAGARDTFSQGTGLASMGTWWEGTIGLKHSSIAVEDAAVTYLYFSTRGSPVEEVRVGWQTFQRDAGQIEQVGYSTAPCRETGPMRSYRVEVNLLPGRSSSVPIRVTLEDPDGVADGASLLLIGVALPEFFTKGGVVLVDGASVMNENHSSISAALPMTINLKKVDAALHVGMADGQSAYESGILFRTSADVVGSVVTPASEFSGSDGPNWDDITYDLSASGLDGSPGLAVISNSARLGPARDCLGWVYAALRVNWSTLTVGTQFEVLGINEEPKGWDVPPGLDLELPPDYSFEPIPPIPEIIEWPPLPKPPLPFPMPRK